MRRAAIAVLVGGFAIGIIVCGLEHQPAIFGASASVRAPAADASLAADFTPVRSIVTAAPSTGMKTVWYRGYQVSVPASWPVYFLDNDPDQCVRYDVSAVYLGTPGASQDCPAGLVGRADTISIGGPKPPTPPVSPASSSTVSQTTPAQAAAQHVQAGMIFQNADQHEVAMAMPDAAPAVTGTYGTDPSAVEQMLASVRLAQPAPSAVSHGPAGPGGPDPFLPPGRQPPPPAPAAPQYTPAPASPATSAQASPQASASPTAPTPSPATPVPSTPPTPSPSAPTLAGSASASPAVAPAPAAGFDTCTAPSLHTMRVWRAKYSATAIYIGGQMMACDYGNLSAGWVRQAEAMGWSLLPTYVGLQAPCDSFSGKINPKKAAAQGTAAASNAIADANSFGLGKRTPIYYDMEAYNHTKARCVTAVLTFLDAWTRRLRAQGYVSGVYSSAGSGIIDLQTTTRVAGHPLAEPQAIWFALWDNATNLTGAPYMTPAVWPMATRSKQYAGPHVVKVGGIKLDIDSDLVASAVARG